jgi:hypothetical protein
MDNVWWTAAGFEPATPVLGTITLYLRPDRRWLRPPGQKWRRYFWRFYQFSYAAHVLRWALVVQREMFTQGWLPRRLTVWTTRALQRIEADKRIAHVTIR